MYSGDMGSANILAAAGVLVFTGASFFFALAETALFSLGAWQVKLLAERNPVKGGIVASLLANPQVLIATIALGNSFALAAMLAVCFWMGLRGDWPWMFSVPGLLVLSLVGGEVLPKTLAVRRPEVWALRLARPLTFMMLFSGPLCRVSEWMFSSIIRLGTRTLKAGQRAEGAGARNPGAGDAQSALTDADYQELVELAFQSGTLELSEKEIILQIVSLDRRTVKDVLRPRSLLAAIPDDLSIEEMVAAARKYRHGRLPIYDESPDTIVGVLNTRAFLLNPEGDLADVIDFPSFVPESMNLLQLFISLQRQGRGLAIVLDEFGGTAGVVGLQDILEVIIGRVRPDTGLAGMVLKEIGAGRWRVSGAVRIDDLRRVCPGIGTVPEVETMGGLLTLLLDVVPGLGDSASYRGLKLTAVAVEERRVRELLVETSKGGGEGSGPVSREESVVSSSKRPNETGGAFSKLVDRFPVQGSVLTFFRGHEKGGGEASGGLEDRFSVQGSVLTFFKRQKKMRTDPIHSGGAA